MNHRTMPAAQTVLAAIALAAITLTPINTRAGTPSDQPADTSNPPGGEAAPVSAGITQRANMLGEMNGLRTYLGKYGVTLNLSETDEVLGNVTGGTHRTADYDGITTASVAIDTGTAANLPGGTLFASALQIHGRNLSADSLGVLQTATGIEADRTTRLWELYYDQKFANDTADIKLGQQSLDQEFIVSSNALLFLNAALGWPLLPAADLPGGGPAYPLASLGARIKAQLSPAVTVLAGVFNGTPTAKFNSGDPQLRNASGASFPLNGGQLFIAEAQYSFPAEGALVTPDDPGPLPGTYKLGAWVDTLSFADQRFDNTGLSLANPASNATPLGHRDNWSIYAVADQTIWAEHGGGKTLNAFIRVMGAPADRNLVTVGVNAGLVLHNPWFHRDADSLGLGLGYGRVGNAARALDRDIQQVTGTGFARSQETFIEATYQYVPWQWWQIQPDFQYVFNPGGGIANPDQPADKLHNEAIFGLRSNIVF